MSLIHRVMCTWPGTLNLILRVYRWNSRVFKDESGRGQIVFKSPWFHWKWRDQNKLGSVEGIQEICGDWKSRKGRYEGHAMKSLCFVWDHFLNLDLSVRWCYPKCSPLTCCKFTTQLGEKLSEAATLNKLPAPFKQKIDEFMLSQKTIKIFRW